MTGGAWHGGKGDATRPEGERGAWSRGYEGIDWSAHRKPTEDPARALDSVSMDPPAVDDGVRYLTAGVDVAEDRIEVAVVGWPIERPGA